MSLLKLLFGREDASEADEVLLHTIIAAHRNVSNMDNISSLCFRASMRGGNTIAHAIASGVLATGFRHAPIEQARITLFGEAGVHEASLKNVQFHIWAGRIIPGFGHDLYKDKIDPAFQVPFDALSQEYQFHLNAVAATLRLKTGKDIFPNAASITAAVAEQLQLPPGGETLIFLIGRSAGWITL